MADAPTMTVVTDFAAASDFEKKHTPMLTIEAAASGSVAVIEVGHEVPHPNGTDHYITFIELLADGAPIARFDLTPGVVAPRVSVAVDLPAGTTLTAIEHCNLHGWWSYSVTL